MRKIAIPILFVLLLPGCAGGILQQRTDLTPQQRQEMSLLINLSVACDNLATVVRSLTFQKKAGNISPAVDRKVISVLDFTDPVCKPGAPPPTGDAMRATLEALRAHLAELQRLEMEAKRK